MTIPTDRTAFTGLAEWELHNVLATADHLCYGLHMSQHPQAVVKLNQLLNATRPARIVEIGTGNGGLTVLFALYCRLMGAYLHTYDQQTPRHLDLIESIAPESFCLGDALGDEVVQAVISRQVAREGRTLLVCDAGKALEANLYIPAMKRGDFVLMHDHSPTPETFARDIKGRVWNWHESWDDRVAEVCAKHGIVQTTAFHDVVWFCGWKATS